MKMTGLEWRYLQKIALDHPYFDTHALPLTEKEAKTIVEANIGMTGKEFVDSIYAKLGMTRPKEEKKRFAWLRNIGELLTVKPIRRIAVAVLVVLLMTVFFAATPVGKAIAESVIQYIATLFEDGRVVANRNDNEATINPVFSIPDSGKGKTLDQDSSGVYVDSFEAFKAAMGVRPMALPFRHTMLYYEYDKLHDYLSLHAEYETPKGKVTTTQIWNAEAMAISTSTGFAVYDADSSIYYSVEEDGTIAVTMPMENSIIIVYARGSFSVDDIIGILTDK